VTHGVSKSTRPGQDTVRILFRPCCWLVRAAADHSVRSPFPLYVPILTEKESIDPSVLQHCPRMFTYHMSIVKEPLFIISSSKR